MAVKRKLWRWQYETRPTPHDLCTAMKDIEVVRVNVRNCDDRWSHGRVFNDVVCGGVYFEPGETKSLEISEPEAAGIREPSRRSLGFRAC